MSKIIRTQTVEVDLSSEELADLFCELDNDAQAEFFNHLGLVFSSWLNPDYQLDAITKSPILNSHGKEIIKELSSRLGE